MTIDERIEAGKREDADILDELIWGRDYYVRYVKLPYNIGGAITANEDCTYNIYINSRHYPDRQTRSFLHELVHAEGGHLDRWKELPDEIKEWEADNLTGKILWTAG